eukprot:2417165-Rhodomonas_salina.2
MLPGQVDAQNYTFRCGDLLPGPDADLLRGPVDQNYTFRCGDPAVDALEPQFNKGIRAGPLKKFCRLRNLSEA